LTIARDLQVSSVTKLTVETPRRRAKAGIVLPAAAAFAYSAISAFYLLTPYRRLTSPRHKPRHGSIQGRARIESETGGVPPGEAGGGA
jgi:hypothetical protein